MTTVNTKPTWIIKLDKEEGFYMLDPDNQVVTAGSNATPRTLSRIAWAKGAFAVKYDFDLNLDPDK